MKYLLDTNTISYLLDRHSLHHEQVYKKLLSLQDDDILITSILCLYEYSFGIANATNKDLKNKLIQSKEDILNEFILVNLNHKGSEIFGELKKDYKEKIGINKKAIERHNIDLIIASQAIAENAILVSNDNIFENISKFRNDFYFENWIK